MISLGTTFMEKPDLVADLVRSGKLANAVRGTLNDAAFHIREDAIKELGREFVLRNTWTKRGVFVTKIPSGRKNINDMEALIGADKKRDYLAEHEEGRVKYEGGPTESARVKSEWTKIVSRTKYISKLGVKDMRSFRSTAKTRRGKVYAMLAMASRRKEKSLLSLSLAQDAFPAGLYQFEKGSRKGISSRGFPRMTLLYARNRRPKKVRRRPWLDKARQKLTQDIMDDLFAKNATRQLGR